MVIDYRNTGLARLETGITGLDSLTGGGLPVGRTAVAAGAAGTGKTVLCTQYLAEGIELFDQPGVFVSFEESPADIRDNTTGFGWDIARYEAEKKWAFVDGSPKADQEETFVGGDFDLAGLRTRILHSIKKINAQRVSIDSISSLFMRFPDRGVIRRELLRLCNDLKSVGVTTVLTAEHLEGADRLTRHGVEEFVADTVMVLRNTPDLNRRRRTMEVLKMRGGRHNTGEYPFSISTPKGIDAIPLGSVQLDQPSSMARITAGTPELDRMCGGGFFQDSVTIVSGATGTGKTLTGMHFLRGATADNQRAVIFGYEESRPQLVRNAKSWGIDLEQLEADGHVQIHCQFPESAGLEDHLVEIRRVMVDFKPGRIVVDSVSALQRIGSLHAYREFVLGLTSLIKQNRIAGMYTTTLDSIFGGKTVTEQHISTLTDAIVLLRYVENAGQMERGVMVLKMRGSSHDKQIRRFNISSEGMVIGDPFSDMHNILGGNPLHFTEAEE